jgi:hypothetical protein
MLCTILIIIAMLVASGKAYTIADKASSAKSTLHVATKILVGLYFGWISVAAIANITSYLHVMSYNLILQPEIWGLLTILLAGGITTTVIIRTRSKILFTSFSVAVVWALIGLIVSNYGTSTLMIISCIISIISIILTKLWRYTPYSTLQVEDEELQK